jgi:hypothetical protein
VDETEEHEHWQAVVSGDEHPTWELWSAPIERSTCLTRQGQRTARWAADEMARFFGLDWLKRSFLEGSPVIELPWWPSNDVPATLLRIIRLGASLALLKATAGGRFFRQRCQESVDFWNHALMQLEVGGLALRSGWDVELEPELLSKKRGDLLLRRADVAMLVETTRVRFSDEFVSTERFNDLAFSHLRAIEMQRGVEISGSLGDVVEVVELRSWLDEVDEIAASVERVGISIELTPPGGGRMLISAPKGTDKGQRTISGATTEPRDEWLRVNRAIANKVSQATDPRYPLWIRLDTGANLWHFTTASTLPRFEMHAALATNIAAILDREPGLSGVVVSGALEYRSGNHQPGEWTFLDGRGCGLVVANPNGFWREAVFVAKDDALDQLAEWRTWYLDEPTWLDWALSHQGHPQVTELLLRRVAA